MFRRRAGQACRRIQCYRTRPMDKRVRLRAGGELPSKDMHPHRGDRRAGRTTFSVSPRRLQREQRDEVITAGHTRPRGSTADERQGQSADLALRPGDHPNSRSGTSTGSRRRRELWQLIRLRHRVQRRRYRPTMDGIIATRTPAAPAGRRAQRGGQSPATVRPTSSPAPVF